MILLRTAESIGGFNTFGLIILTAAVGLPRFGHCFHPDTRQQVTPLASRWMPALSPERVRITLTRLHHQMCSAN